MKRESRRKRRKTRRKGKRRRTMRKRRDRHRKTFTSTTFLLTLCAVAWHLLLYGISPRTEPMISLPFIGVCLFKWYAEIRCLTDSLKTIIQQKSEIIDAQRHQPLEQESWKQTSQYIEHWRKSLYLIHTCACTVRKELSIKLKHMSHVTCNFYMIAALSKLNKDDFESKIIMNRLFNILKI